MSDTFEFHKEEYKTIRQEILDTTKEAVTFTQWSVIGSSAVIAWLASLKPDVLNPLMYRIAWWIPLVLSSFGALRVWGLLTRIMMMSEYLRKIENQYSLMHMVGWEHFINRKRKTLKGRFHTCVAVVFWVVMVLGSLLLGYINSTRPLTGLEEQSRPKPVPVGLVRAV